jgi:methyl-galactoside transport system substrate-binding protein
MTILRKSLVISLLIIIITTIVLGGSIKRVSAEVTSPQKNLAKVDVLLYKFDDAYISLVRKNLEEIQKQNEGKVEFTFYDGQDNQKVQNKILDNVLKEKVDLLLINLVDTRVTQEVINKVKQKNIPVVLFNREPISVDAIRSYKKACFVGTDAKEAGILQGRIIVDLWKKDKSAIDKNKDDILQYVMLQGERGNIEAIDRTRYSVSTINDAGINTQELASRICNWDKDVAKEAFETVFLQYGTKIETIISNNDEMAIGAIEVLQKYGYNKGDKAKTIPIVGVDALPEAQELIKKGFMTGSILQDAHAMADALYTVGMNFVEDKNPLDGTNYKFDDTGVAIRIPYSEYVANNKVA